LVGPLPESARSVVLDLVRYTSIDVGEPFSLEITAVTDPDAAPRAIVTAVTQP